MQELPEGLCSELIDCGAVSLHVVSNRAPDPADDRRPAIVLLHGFPEYWAAWKPVLPPLAEDFLVIAPDQRGYNRSDAPPGAENYAVRHLAGDVLALADRLIGRRRFLLAGHDWGASVAYALAIGAPERLTGLIVVNGVHPVCFQRALIGDPYQARASQYIHWLRAPQAAARLAENGFARLLAMLERFSATPWLSEAERAAYVEAWSRPGRLEAMVNWYRASPLVVPRPDGAADEAPLADGTADRFGIRVPHLLIWGGRDTALRPSAHAGLEDFAPDLRRLDIADGDHWVIHSHGGRVADEIRQFARHCADGAPQ
ncbi:MAG: alpha/beta hydrolase [Alphaproteobacteria bacterium]|nr:MAG: alpha/beta hydrolase [Alphaproteobacteria bacterium]